LEYEASLNQLLSSLGMDRAFDADQAEFDLIYSSGDPLYISQVNHKSFIRVDEEGTEAAAATAVMAVTGALFPRPEKPFTMIVDRPFFFVIREEWTKMILFAGFVVEP
jgi:serpin B